MLHKAVQHLVLTLVLVCLVVGCAQTAQPAPAATYKAGVATAWFDLMLRLVQETPGFTPPVASRAFGYAGVTLYESIVAGMPNYQTLAGQLNGLAPLPQPASGEDYHWPTAANSALADITRKLFANASSENMTATNALEDQFAAEFKSTLNPAVFTRSVDQGRKIADTIFDWSLSDRGHEGYLRNFPVGYTPPVGAGLWVPTPPKFSPAMQPYWGANRTFVLKNVDECQPPPPPAYSEDPASQFYREANEVYDTVSDLTPEQRDIALFWADDAGKTPTPPGHSMSILSQVLKQKDATLDIAAEAYAKVGIAVADGFISCWYTKFNYNVIRPITYIQKVIDPKWDTPVITDPVITPPVPEYPSGHSVQSAAAMQVLTDLFGDNFAFTDHTHDARGLAPRSFGSFFAAAQEAAISRLYGGIDYRSAIEPGIEQGKCIGKQVSSLKFKK
jgi:hypothetical protein